MNEPQAANIETRLTIIKAIIDNINIFFKNMEQAEPMNIIIHLPNIQTHITLLEEENEELSGQIEQKSPHERKFYEEQHDNFTHCLISFKQRYRAKKQQAMAPSGANPHGLDSKQIELNIRLARQNLLQAQSNNQLASNVTEIMEEYNKMLNDNISKTNVISDQISDINSSFNKGKAHLAKIRFNRFMNKIGGWVIFAFLLIIDIIILIIRFKKKR